MTTLRSRCARDRSAVRNFASHSTSSTEDAVLSTNALAACAANAASARAMLISAIADFFLFVCV